MTFKNLLGKLLFGELQGDLASVGRQVEQRIAASLDLEPVEEFADLRELRDLNGDVTGYVKSFRAPKLQKMAFLSIDIMTGMRYFNIHVIPDHHYRLPRFNFEGMVCNKDSQLSMDLYPDHDIVLDFDFVREHYAGVSKIYDKAKGHKLIHPEASRLPHMRALCSPYFLLANKVPPEAAGDMEQFALAYFDEWLAIYRRAERVSEEVAEQQLQRRLHIARTIIENDPDRDKVVNAYGEETTCMIEKAAML